MYITIWFHPAATTPPPPPHNIHNESHSSHAHTRINYPQFALVCPYPNKSAPSHIQAEIDP